MRNKDKILKPPSSHLSTPFSQDHASSPFPNLPSAPCHIPLTVQGHREQGSWSAHNSSFVLLLPSHPALLLQCGFLSMGESPSENTHLLNCDLFHGCQVVSTVVPEAHPPLLLLCPWCSQDCFSEFFLHSSLPVLCFALF